MIKNYLKNISISKAIFINTFIISLLLIIAFGSFLVYREVQIYHSESETIKNKLIKKNKEIIRNQVNDVIDYIYYKKSHLEKRTKEKLKNRVYEAYSISMHLYKIYKDQLPLNDLKKIIIESLRTIRYDVQQNDASGYFFATSLKGIEKLFADRPEFEGKNVLDIQDKNGQFVIKDMIQIARDTGEGFYTYTWTKPNVEGKNFPKIAFIKYFEPFDWFIGTGAYFDDMEDQIKAEVLERIEKIQSGADGYIFVFNYDGLCLSHIQEKNVGTNLMNLTDPDGTRVISQLVQAAKNEGGYVQYIWNKPSLEKKVPKLSYADSFEDWRWVIGTGVYLDDIENALAARLEQYRENVREQSLFIVAVFFIILFSAFFLARMLSIRIQRGVEVFVSFFEKTASSYDKIDKDVLTFSEFKRMASFANSMVDDRQQAEEALGKSESQLRKFFRFAPIGIFQSTPHGKYLMLNPRFAEMIGYDVEELLQLESIADLYVDSGQREEVKRLLSENDVLEDYHINLWCKNGQDMWMAIYVKTERNEQGEILYYDGFTLDVSVPKNTEKALRASEDKYKKLVNSSPDAIALVDEFGRFLTVNPAMAKSLGIEQQELEGQYHHQVISQDVADKRIMKGKEAIEEGQVIFFEDTRQGRFFQNYYVPISTSGNPRTYQVVSREVTDLKKTQTDLHKTLTKLRQAVEGTIQALSIALEQRDAYTAGHQERVTKLACAIAREMGREEDALQGLYLAGMVHDIGKISIPNEILAKPTKLSAIEFGLIKQHAQSGYNILKDIEFPWPIADIVVQHHERIDGSGYPKGLHGEEILLEAKILAVADVVEAMSSHRPYRPGLGIEAALEEIENKKGILFDPEVAEICLTLFRKKGFLFDEDKERLTAKG
jgi:PAS domain S-box-containing protein/putative nucleotidyltransferase with HDIG domain